MGLICVIYLLPGRTRVELMAQGRPGSCCNKTISKTFRCCKQGKQYMDTTRVLVMGITRNLV